MKQDKPQRRAPMPARRQSSASAILAGKRQGSLENYTSFEWMLLFATFLTITLISFLFTPYTHQLDEIKNVLLMFAPPFLLIAALARTDFSAFTWKRNGALILLGLYFVAMCFSWVINPYKLMGEQTIWFNLGVATFTVVFACFLNSENKVRKTMIFFVTLAFVSTILGLFLYAGRYTEGFYKDMLNSAYWQTPERRQWSTLFFTLFSSSSDMYSFILNSDFYAAFLVMLIPISLSMFFVENRTGFKIFALSSFLLMNVCLFLTNSNDSFIAMAVAYPLYIIVGYFYVKDWGLSTRFVITFSSCLVALLILVAIMMLPKLSATFDFKSAAFEGRRVLWGGGFWPWIYGNHLDGKTADIVSVIFGVGPGGYRHYFPWFRRPDFFDQQINNVTTFGHNFYLDTLLETGLVGLVLLVAFHVRVMADGLRQIRTTTSRTHLFYQLAILSGLIGIAIQNYSSPNNRWAVAGMTYWCMFGLSMGLASLDNPSASGDNINKRIGGIPVYKLSKWACLALAIIFFFRCVAPGAQFIDYWKGAVYNAEGLRDMESVYPGMPQDQQDYLLKKAQLEFENAIEANPTFATSYYKLGHIYNQQEMSDKAIETYEKLDHVNANYSEVQLNLGIMYAQKAGKLPETAKKMQQEAQVLLQDMQAATGARRDELKEQYGEKMEALKTLVSNLSKERERLMEISYNHMKEAAHQSLKPNTQYLTGSIGRELVSIYEEAGETEKAKKLREEIKGYFRSLLEYKPKLDELQADQKEYYPKAQKQLLSLAQETNNDDEIIEVLKGMVVDNPDNPLMLQALLESYDRAGRSEAKLKYLEKAVHADPTDAQLRLELANAYKKAGQNDKYISELRRVEVLSPQSPELLKQLYGAYKESGDKSAMTSYADKLSSIGISAAELDTTATAAETSGVADERATKSRTVTIPDTTATINAK